MRPMHSLFQPPKYSHTNYRTLVKIRPQIAQHLRLSLPTLAPVLLPVHPTALVLRNILVPKLLRQLRRRCAPHARFAVEHQLLVHRRLAEAEAIFELLFWEEQGIGLGFDRNVDGVWDVAVLVLVRFSNVYDWSAGCWFLSCLITCRSRRDPPKATRSIASSDRTHIPSKLTREQSAIAMASKSAEGV